MDVVALGFYEGRKIVMTEITIFLDTIQKVKKFVNVITVMDGDFDIISGKYVVDAKSILGIFSLDLSQPLILQIETQEDENRIKELLEKFTV